MTMITGLATGNTAATRANNCAVVNSLLSAGADTLEFPKTPTSIYFDVGQIFSQFDGTRIFGQGEGATKLVAVGNGPLFDTNGLPRQTIAGMTIQGYGNHTGGPVISYHGPAGSQGANNGKFYDLTFEACYNGIECSAFNSTLIDRIQMISMRGSFGVRAFGNATNQRSDLLRVKNLTYSVNQSLKAAAQATGIVVEGFVNTILFDDVNITRPWRGVLIHNPAGLPYPYAPKLIEARSLRVDFPTVQAMILNSVQEAFFDQCYWHGSETEDNVTLDSACQQIKISQSKITGAAKTNLYTDADDTELVGNDYAYANQLGGGQGCVIFGVNSWTGRVIGGCAKGGNQPYGLMNWHAGNGPNIKRVATDQIMGTNGPESGF